MLELKPPAQLQDMTLELAKYSARGGLFLMNAAINEVHLMNLAECDEVPRLLYVGITQCVRQGQFTCDNETVNEVSAALRDHRLPGLGITGFTVTLVMTFAAGGECDSY